MSKFLNNIIMDNLNEAQTVLNDFKSNDECLKNLLSLSKKGIRTIEGGGKIILCGNGGSFADAQHICAELVSRFKFDRIALPSICLGTNASVISAISNDYGYKKVFERELSALATAKDMVVAISTSGNSENIIKAVEYCKSSNITVMGLTGANGGNLATIVDCIKVPSNITARIQEIHIKIGHILCDCIETEIFKKD